MKDDSERQFFVASGFTTPIVLKKNFKKEIHFSGASVAMTRITSHLSLQDSVITAVSLKS